MVCSNASLDMTANAGLWSTNENFHGIEIQSTTSCFYNKNIGGLTIQLKKEGSDSSDLFYFRIYDGSGTLQASSDGVAQSTLSTTATDVTKSFTTGASYTTQVGDKIGIWYSGGSSSGGKIRSTKSSTYTTQDGNLGVKYQGSWQTSGVYQGYVITAGGGPSSQVLLPPPYSEIVM